MSNNYLTEERFKTILETTIQTRLETAFDEFAIIMKQEFDHVHQRIGEVNERVDGLTERVGGLTKDVKILTQRVDGISVDLQGLSQKVHRHLEITDEHHHEHNEEHKTYRKWFKQIVTHQKIKLDPPISPETVT